jgi:hypothetical protein
MRTDSAPAPTPADAALVRALAGALNDEEDEVVRRWIEQLLAENDHQK